VPRPALPRKGEIMLTCAKCGQYLCWTGNLEKLPKNCPINSKAAMYDKTTSIYKNDPSQMACWSARVEAEGYGVWTRMREVIEFAKRSGFTKLGLAFCIGLRKEALEVNRILEESGFSVSSIACKTGSRPKEDLGLKEEEKVKPGRFEAMCNPAAQAMLLNEEGTELNVLLGLCVGHDSMFFQHSKAPVTVLAVKDRATGHNPLVAIYASHYFNAKLKG
jgi:uncharacterized metal-binding protein